MSSLLLIAALFCPSQEISTRRNIRYARHTGTDARRNRLDVYARNGARDAPVILWVHGGAWTFGSKALMNSKVPGLVNRGYVLVSMNYRFHPQATYRQQTDDVAAAVSWVTWNIGRFGGDPRRVVLMGHSAGAHLSGLTATDSRSLRKYDLSSRSLSGVILIDGAGYDIPRQVKSGATRQNREMYRRVFTAAEETQRDASPYWHIKKGEKYPPFLMLHVATRRDSKYQAEQLAEKLRSVGGQATVFAARDRTHMTINRELGRTDDPATRELHKFLKRAFAPAEPGKRRGRPQASPGI